MLSEVIGSNPLLRAHAALLSREAVEEALVALAPFFRRDAAIPFKQVAAFDATKATRDQTIQWFESLDLPGSEVDVLWVSQMMGLRLPVGVFIPHYDDLWFPSSHDVIISDTEKSYLLELDHEEHFTLWKKTET